MLEYLEYLHHFYSLTHFWHSFPVLSVTRFTNSWLHLLFSLFDCPLFPNSTSPSSAPGVLFWREPSLNCSFWTWCTVSFLSQQCVCFPSRVLSHSVAIGFFNLSIFPNTSLNSFRVGGVSLESLWSVNILNEWVLETQSSNCS